jgi:hypothetical protein
VEVGVRVRVRVRVRARVIVRLEVQHFGHARTIRVEIQCGTKMNLSHILSTNSVTPKAALANFPPLLPRCFL